MYQYSIRSTSKREMRSFFRHTVFLLFWIKVIFAQDTCDSLQHYEDTHPNCLAYTYTCSGVTCDDNITYVHITFQKCEDPVTVDVFMYSSKGEHFSYLSYSFNQSETVETYDELDNFTAIMDRNASDLGFELYWVHEDDGPQWLIDALYVPLNPADCMCTSMERIAANLSDSGFYCHTENDCTQLNCTVNDSPLQSVNLTVYPCDDPPSLDLDVNLWTTVYRTHASDNTTTVLDNGVTVKIEIWHFDYSMDIQISTSSDNITQVFLSRHKIILDKTDCGPLRPFNLSSESTEPPTAVTEPTIPSTTDSSYDTCMALTQIALVDGNLCSTNQMCNALECEIGDQRVEMAVDSCHHPPGVRMAVYDSDDNLLYNRSFYNGTHTLQYRNQPLQFIVTVKQLPPSSISVKVTGRSFGFEVPIIPETVIPIDDSSCSTSPTPTSGPPTTCSAMHSIQSALAEPFVDSSCRFPIENNCTVLNCNLYDDSDMTIRLLRCAHPPAVRLTLGSSDQEYTYFDHTFNHSEVVPMDGIYGLNGTSLNVTLDHLCPTAIGFEVDMLSSGFNFPVIPYTIIPVNTTGCGPSGEVCPTPTAAPPTPSSTTGTHSHSTGTSTHGHSTGTSTHGHSTGSSTASESGPIQSTTVALSSSPIAGPSTNTTRQSSNDGPSSAVVVPAVVLPVVVLILIIAVIIVIVGIYLGRRRHFRDYRFRRMAMSELKDEDC